MGGNKRKRDLKREKKRKKKEGTGKGREGKERKGRKKGRKGKKRKKRVKTKLKKRQKTPKEGSGARPGLGVPRSWKRWNFGMRRFPGAPRTPGPAKSGSKGLEGENSHPRDHSRFSRPELGLGKGEERGKNRFIGKKKAFLANKIAFFGTRPRSEHP